MLSGQVNGWQWAGFALGALTALCVLTFLFFGRWLLWNVLLPLTSHLAPGLDAPDNWAVAITCYLRSTAVLATVAALCFAIGLFVDWKKRRSAGA